MKGGDILLNSLLLLSLLLPLNCCRGPRTSLQEDRKRDEREKREERRKKKRNRRKIEGKEREDIN